MSAILRWFHDGDVRYHAYFRTLEHEPAMRELIIATRDWQATDLVPRARTLEDYSDAELLRYAQRLRDGLPEHAREHLADAAAD